MRGGRKRNLEKGDGGDLIHFWGKPAGKKGVPTKGGGEKKTRDGAIVLIRDRGGRGTGVRSPRNEYATTAHHEKRRVRQKESYKGPGFWSEGAAEMGGTPVQIKNGGPLQ